MVIKFSKGERFILQKFEELYLGRTFINFLYEMEMLEDFQHGQVIKIKEDGVRLFHLSIENLLSESLEKLYFTPRTKHIQKYHKQYERFVYKEKKYSVHISFVGVSRLLWVLNNIRVVTEMEMNRENSNITFSEFSLLQ